jgi:hypothetical protein
LVTGRAIGFVHEPALGNEPVGTVVGRRVFLPECGDGGSDDEEENDHEERD